MIDDELLDRRVRTAYVTALRHTHEGGSIQFHIGTDVMTQLKALAIFPDDSPVPQPAIFGWPVVEANAHLGVNYIGVHVIHQIH